MAKKSGGQPLLAVPWSDDAAARLKAAISLFGTQEDVARAARVSRATLTAIINNRATPKLSKLLAICSVINADPRTIVGADVSPEWLTRLAGLPELYEPAGRVLLRDAQRLLPSRATRRADEDFPGADLSQLAAVPMDHVQASAGPGAIALEEGKTADFFGFPRAWLKQWFGSYDQLRLVGIKGDSMEPTLSDGDLAMIDLARREPSDGVYALVLDGMLLVKRLALAGPGIVRVISDNKLSDGPRDIDVEAEADNFRVVGRVVWAGGKL